MKKFLKIVVELKMNACLIFTGEMIIYTIIDLLFGHSSLSYSMVFQFLAIAVISSILQLFIISDFAIKKLKMRTRMLIFMIAMLVILISFAIIFKWFAIDLPVSWAIFGAIFLVTFMGITIGFNIYYKILGEKYSQRLNEYIKTTK